MEIPRLLGGYIRTIDEHCLLKEPWLLSNLLPTHANKLPLKKDKYIFLITSGEILIKFDFVIFIGDRWPSSNGQNECDGVTRESYSHFTCFW